MSELFAKKPVMLEFGSYTSPQFRQQVAPTESLIAKYRDRVQFVLVYVIEPHPFGSQSPYANGEWQALYSFDVKGSPVTQPQTYDERARLAARCVKDAGITSLILVDELNNPVWQIYGQVPNLAYLIGSNGEVLEAQAQYDVRTMDDAIRSHLGNR